MHALIVVQRGVVQYEWYAPHWSRNRLTQSQSMHKSLMGLAQYRFSANPFSDDLKRLNSGRSIEAIRRPPWTGRGSAC